MISSPDFGTDPDMLIGSRSGLRLQAARIQFAAKLVADQPAGRAA